MGNFSSSELNKANETVEDLRKTIKRLETQVEENKIALHVSRYSMNFFLRELISECSLYASIITNGILLPTEFDLNALRSCLNDMNAIMTTYKEKITKERNSWVAKWEREVDMSTYDDYDKMQMNLIKEYGEKIPDEVMKFLDENETVQTVKSFLKDTNIKALTEDKLLETTMMLYKLIYIGDANCKLVFSLLNELMVKLRDNGEKENFEMMRTNKTLIMIIIIILFIIVFGLMYKSNSRRQTITQRNENENMLSTR